ncbi:hypothetical protein BX257_2974 [Streptomyces sp. 3212.3]|nr:hypothetical protein BX257_2974 [Streptomyces sp. 3212.3]
MSRHNMSTVTVLFEGGPFDGRTEQWPLPLSFGEDFSITPAWDPNVCVIYTVHSVTVGPGPNSMIICGYARTAPTA